MDSVPASDSVPSLRKEPRWKTTKFINPFSDLSPYQKLTCPIHERCDLQCDPTADVVIRAVDICLTPSDSEDESENAPSEEGDVGDDGDDDDDAAHSDSGSSLPSVAPVKVPLRPDHHLGDLQFTMGSRTPAGLYVPDRTEPTVIDESVPHFEYDELDSSTRQIRLIKIKPAIFRADVLDCEMVTVSLATEQDSDAIPEYDALSYCWDMNTRPPSQQRVEPSTGPRRILVNGKQLLIQESLALALHRYRRLGCRYTHRNEERWKGKAAYIWADGICIDQTDMKEKAAQILLMGDIYTRARRVFVNLGFVSDDWIAALHLMKSIEYLTQFASPRGRLINEDLLFGDFEIPPTDHIAWLALGYILEMPWFTRTWVVQEVALNQRDPIVMVGTFCFGMSLFADSLDFAVLQGYSSAMAVDVSRRSVGRQNLARIWLLRRSVLTESRPPSGLFDIFHSFNATDPRDKIFGMLSLIHPDDRIIPDYECSVEQVYTAFSARAAENGHIAQLFDLAGLQRRGLNETSLPSWVPDWRVPPRLPTIVTSMFANKYRASSTATATIDNRASQAACQVVSKTHTSALEISIFVAEVISETTEVLFPHSTLQEREKREVSDFEAVVTFFDNHQELYSQNYGGTRAELLEAFSRTLLMDVLNVGGKILTLSEIPDPVAMFLGVLNDPEKKGLLVLDPTARVRSPMDSFKTRVHIGINNRRLAVTGSGFMALVPPVSLPGDVLCIIPPLTVPFVLRKIPSDETNSPTQYQLVGDAYVHGMMYGEMLAREDYAVETVWII